MEASARGLRVCCRGLLVVALGLLLAACAGRSGQSDQKKQSIHEQEVAKRVSFDLSCPTEQISMQTLSSSMQDATIGVTGCGQKATYTCLCEYYVMYACTQSVCVMNTASKGQSEAAPASSSPEAELPPE